MNVSISFSGEIEGVLERLAAAEGKDVATFVRDFVAERVGEEADVVERPTTHEEFVAKLRGIIKRHGISVGHVDDSRESIYAGRGE